MYMEQIIDWHSTVLTPNTVMSADFKTTQNVRRFFQAQIGEPVTFDRAFRRWLLANRGATLAAAIVEYQRQKNTSA